MRDFTDDLRDLRRRLAEAHVYLRIDELRAKLPQLETEAGRPDLWDDQERAKAVSAEPAGVTDDLTAYDSPEGREGERAFRAKRKPRFRKVAQKR